MGGSGGAAAGAQESPDFVVEVTEEACGVSWRATAVPVAAQGPSGGEQLPDSFHLIGGQTFISLLGF